MWRRLALLAAFLALGYLAWLNYPRPQRDFVNFRLGQGEYLAVVSRRPPEITLGLSGRETIGADAMLFILPAREQSVFWMYRMRFPLDFVWLADDKVIDIQQNIPPPGPNIPQNQIATVRPSAQAEAVLELPAGFVAARAIKIGDPFALSGPYFRRVW